MSQQFDINAGAWRNVGLIALALIGALLCFFDCSTSRFEFVAPAYVVLSVCAFRLGRPLTMALFCTTLIVASELWLLGHQPARLDGILARAIAIVSISATVLVLRRPMVNAHQDYGRSRDGNSDRLAAISESAARTAHDFNNSIGAIMGFAGFLQESLPANSEERDFALRILAAAERSKDLIEDVRKLSRMASDSRSSAEIPASRH